MIRFGSLVIFISLLMISVITFYIGLKGIFTGEIFLYLKKFHKRSNPKDYASGIAARVWGIIYILFSLILLAILLLTITSVW